MAPPVPPRLETLPDVAPEGGMQLLRIVLFSAIVPLGLLVAPVLTGQLMEQYGLGPEEVGTYFLFELGGISLASLPALWWMRRWNSRQIAVVAAILFIAGNILSVLAGSVPLLLASRLLTGLAGGALMLLCLNAAAQSANSDRVFGFWVAGQLVLGAIGLALLPRLFEPYGLKAFFILTGVLMAVCLPLAFGFDAPTIRPRDRSAGKATFAVVIAAMAGLTLFYLAIGGSWSFMTVIGEALGIERLAAADIVATSSLLGIAGAFAASALAGRISRMAMLVSGFGLLLIALLLLLTGSAVVFTLAACMFKFAWTFVLPAMLAAIGDRDPDGSIMSWSNLVIGLSNAIGPIIAGNVLGLWGQDAMILIETLFAVAAFLVIAALDQGGRRA